MSNGKKTLIPLAVLIAALAFQSSALMPPAFAASTWYVAPTGGPTHSPGGSCSSPAENTISAAISDAAAGDTINVCTGTYVEQVTVSESLTLQAASLLATPTIQAPASLTQNPSGFANIVTISGPTTVVTFSGFTVEGPASSACGGATFFDGIFVEDGATATITHNSILHVRDNPLDGDQCGRAILVGVDTGLDGSPIATVGTATITKNVISDYQKSGIAVDNTGSTATITGNTITGAGPTTLIAQNGIEVLDGASATVNYNKVSGNSYSAACNTQNYFTSCDQSAGILLYDPAVLSTVQGNEVSKNDVGILAYNSGVWLPLTVQPGLMKSMAALTVTSNNVHDNYGYGLVFDGVPALSQTNLISKNPVGILVTDSAANAFVTSLSDQFVGNTVNTFAYSAAGSFSLTFSVETQPFSFPLPHPPQHHPP